MLFNTVDFAVFFPLVLILYWFVFNRSLKLQNLFLIVVSYLFYAFWDWRFLGLIFLSSLVDFLVGKAMKTSANRKSLLLISLFVNLGVLGFFKYYNFFVQSFVDGFSLFGKTLEPSSLNILLPVGISFYTFQTLSYTIDIYRKRIEPTEDIISFFAFVSFFPQLVAGPIERAANLLPQFEKTRVYNKTKSVDGLRLILSGLFKKMVIADNCALIVNEIFANHQDYNGSTLFFGAVFFAFQIYGDFSGYTDIAIGTARLLGFDLMQNFKFPYLARNLSEFWRRWHISLSTWFRDYVYIPLGGSHKSKPRVILNIFIVFILSGLWHGANWTFVFWGFIHALFYVPILFFKTRKTDLDFDKTLPRFKTVIQIMLTFFIVVIAWVFFRAENLQHAFSYLEIMFSSSLFSIPQVSKAMIILLLLYMLTEWFQRQRMHVLDLVFIKHRFVRYAIYYALVAAIFYFGADTKPFIYFQF